ncbi:hypothetical protein DIPPA_51683 [Diplonema papillatum]|nr:hypothetical protein DIPPA_51683 [Diplonema papillatum]
MRSESAEHGWSSSPNEPTQPLWAASPGGELPSTVPPSLRRFSMPRLSRGVPDLPHGKKPTLLRRAQAAVRRGLALLKVLAHVLVFAAFAAEVALLAFLGHRRLPSTPSLPAYLACGAALCAGCVLFSARFCAGRPDFVPKRLAALASFLVCLSAVPSSALARVAPGARSAAFLAAAHPLVPFTSLGALFAAAAVLALRAPAERASVRDRAATRNRGAFLLLAAALSGGWLAFPSLSAACLLILFFWLRRYAHGPESLAPCIAPGALTLREWVWMFVFVTFLASFSANWDDDAPCVCKVAEYRRNTGSWWR